MILGGEISSENILLTCGRCSSLSTLHNCDLFSSLNERDMIRNEYMHLNGLLDLILDKLSATHGVIVAL